MNKNNTVRRRILKGIATLCAAMPLPGYAYTTILNHSFADPATDRALAYKPPVLCTSGTKSSTEGPFYTPSSPHRSDFTELDTDVRPLVLDGLVLNSDCQPIVGAIVDLWHCDETGRYDNQGFRYRGHQYTDATGSYQFKTIRPGVYRGRTEHLHVKVQGVGTRLLTTQLYFPDRTTHNLRDRIFDSELLMNLHQTAGGWHGRFDFIL